jgi:hypothetical protein
MMEVHPSESRLLLALDRELDAADLATIEAHVRTCAECRATWDRFARLSEEIAEYCRTMPSRSPSPVPAPVTATRVWWWPSASWAAPSWAAPPWTALSWARIGRVALVGAAAALLVGVVWDVSARMTAAPHPGLVQGLSAPVTQASQRQQDIPLMSLPGAARDDAAHVAEAGNTGVPATPVSAGGHRSRPRPSATRPGRAAQAVARAEPPTRPTYYWALPYSNGALPLSEGSVVMTVRLSRDQLRLAGIPVSTLQPVTDKPWVRAKVLVGADGLPRAIAFDQD